MLGQVCFLLELRTVESQSRERGVGDVAAAGHADDLQLVAPPAQTDQTFICYLLETRETHKKTKNKQQQMTRAHKHTNTALIL